MTLATGSLNPPSHMAFLTVIKPNDNEVTVLEFENNYAYISTSHKSGGARQAIARKKAQMTPGVELLAVPFGHTPSSGVGQQVVQKEATRCTGHGAGRPTRRARRVTCEK
uniref:Uncharacterized protein n=1 Tax=Romanomermis culicivorax TaxID=13658 RepID=A0A915JIY7_ROMCU